MKLYLQVISVFALVLAVGFACSKAPPWHPSEEDDNDVVEGGGDWECVGDCDGEGTEVTSWGDWECVGDCDPSSDGGGDGDVDADVDGDGDADCPPCSDEDLVLMCIHPEDGGEPYEVLVCARDVDLLLEHGDTLGECGDEPVDPPDAGPGPDPEPDGGVDPDPDAGPEPEPVCEVPVCNERQDLVCHGRGHGPEGARWKCIGKSAVQHHERHGDSDEFCCTP